MTENKPCPFCGKKPDVIICNGYQPYVVCGNDKCRIANIGFTALRWNARPAEDRLRASLKRRARALLWLVKQGQKTVTCFWDLCWNWRDAVCLEKDYEASKRCASCILKCALREGKAEGGQ